MAITLNISLNNGGVLTESIDHFCMVSICSPKISGAVLKNVKIYL